jgi:hypothetical protein
MKTDLTCSLTRFVEILASYSNTAPQVVELFNRVSDAVRKTSSDDVSACGRRVGPGREPWLTTYKGDRFWVQGSPRRAGVARTRVPAGQTSRGTGSAHRLSCSPLVRPAGFLERLWRPSR